MGNFYTNITLRGADQNAVAGYLSERGFRAYVSPTVSGFTVVYEEKSDASQDVRLLETLAARLSEEFSCPALAVLNHDDDVLWYKLFAAGRFLDEYNSAPGFFERADEDSPPPAGGNAGKLAAILGAPDAAGAVEKILRASGLDEYVFEYRRHEDLAKALGMPPFAPGFGFGYIENDELPEELEPDDLRKTF